jgi:alpha-mannosidase
MIQHINAIQTINGVEYSILILMPLPKDYDYAKNQRSQGTVQNKLKIIYKVYNDSSRVDIEIQLDNSAKDHKTCFEIAVPGKLETILKDSYYGLVKQKAAFYEYNDEMTEENLSHHAMEQLSALLDNGKGLMVVSRGIHEFESFHEGNFTKAHYTLVRSVGMLSKKSLNTRKGEAGPCIETPEAQCICRLIHQYAIIPLVDSDETVIMKEANQFLLKPVVICQNTSVSPDDLNQFKFSAMNTLFLKSLKISEDSDGLTARFLNLHNKNASVRFDVKNIKDYRTTNMAEISTKQLAQKEDNHMTINQIGSIKMQFKKQR